MTCSVYRVVLFKFGGSIDHGKSVLKDLTDNCRLDRPFKYTDIILVGDVLVNDYVSTSETCLMQAYKLAYHNGCHLGNSLFNIMVWNEKRECWYTVVENCIEISTSGPIE